MDPSKVAELVRIQTALLFVSVVTPIMIAIVGWFIKRTIERLESRLDKHENSIVELVGVTQRLIGRSEFWNGRDRRSSRG